LALGAGIGCYLVWGFVPLVFQAVGWMGASPWEILTHRILWSVPTAAVFVLLARQGGQVLGLLRRPAVLRWLALSSGLIAINWIVFIWSVNSGRILESSLGYYITPLVSMAGGALVFQERLNRIGRVAIALALVGVAIQATALGHLPWVSLVLAFSFGGYGIVRKRIDCDAQTGFLVESLITAIPGLVYFAWLQNHGGHFGLPVATAWLIALGPITAIPLVLFSWAARRMPLSAMGFLQFLSPTITFAIGLVQGEAFTPLRALSFAFIWSGAAVFLWGAWKSSRRVVTRIAEVEAQLAE
jgi:chloramphenicol-sensitive protein RarD